MARESVLLLTVDLLSLMIRGREVMRRVSIVKGRVGALKSTTSSNSTCMVKCESELSSKDLETEASVAELESTERRPRLAEDAASLRGEIVKVKGLRLAREQRNVLMPGWHDWLQNPMFRHLLGHSRFCMVRPSS